MRLARVPAAATYTTLVREGLEDIRKVLQNGALDPDNGVAKGLGFHAPSREYRRARLALALAAKEAVLFGYVGVRYISLSDMLDVYDRGERLDSHEDIRLLFITDFYLQGDNGIFDHDGRALHRLQSAIMEFQSRGVSVSYSTDVELPVMGWYSAGFVSTLVSRTIAKAVADV